MISDETRLRIEQNAVGICISFAGLMFAAGLALQYGSRVVSRALTWGATQ